LANVSCTDKQTKPNNTEKNTTQSIYLTVTQQPNPDLVASYNPWWNEVASIYPNNPGHNASEMTYIVSGGALNSTHLLTTQSTDVITW